MGQPAVMNIIPGDLSDQRVIDLLRAHLTAARAASPPRSAHALDLTGLRSPDISFWAGWDGERLMAIGALMRLAADHGEVKSMHTAQAARGWGAGSAMLAHIIAAAEARGYRRLSLETGSMAYFQPARALYQRHGFRPCEPFADYGLDPNSVFLTLELRDPGAVAP
jgi:putative acetyltransferase